MTLRAIDEEEIFKLLKSMKHPMVHDDTSYSIDNND